MKKIIVLVILTVALVTCIFAQNGVIREITGEVEIRPVGASAFVPVSVGTAVNLDTIISTGFRSTAVIAIGSSTITVRPLTRLSLAEIQNIDNTENVNINLQAGRIRVDVKPPAGTRANFTVQSPSATASVRGTSFEFDTVNLSVHEGRVVFGGNAGPATVVNSGFFTFVGPEGTAENPVGVTSATTLPSTPVGTPETTVQPAPPTSGDLIFDLRF
jgi:hypothetical protein